VLQLTIDACERNTAELISDLLMEAGAVSITMTDKEDVPILEPDLGTTPLWPEVVIQALYAEMVQAERALMLVTSQFADLTFKLQTLPEQDWELLSRSDFKPMQFGKRLWICPSWTSTPDSAAVNLILDPGLAFGTGTHATTALCLTWLEQASIHKLNVIDYGCGSGILALAALKLGAKHVFAVDIDPQALTATRSNAEVNHISSDQLSVIFPEDLHEPGELILANILLSPLLMLQQRFHQLLMPYGKLVVSGILQDQMSSVIDAYSDNFHLASQSVQDGWALLEFTRRQR
jgi:ribosomal protein L11 methyltransferase